MIDSKKRIKTTYWACLKQEFFPSSHQIITELTVAIINRSWITFQFQDGSLMRNIAESLLYFKNHVIYQQSRVEMRNFPYDESDYSENKLDIAFIAEDSREVLSVSMCSSEVDSLSGISRVHSNSHVNSPFLNFQPEISSMEEWPVQNPDIFGKKLRKRGSRKSQSIPEEIEESNEEEREIQKLSKCTKKRIGQKMKVITVGAVSISPTNSYALRSKKQKAQQMRRMDHISQQSSSEEIRQMVQQIDGKCSQRQPTQCQPGQQNEINFLVE